MSYSDVADYIDPVLIVTDEDRAAADTWIDALLRQRGIDPVEEVAAVLPVTLLRDLAVYHASGLAAIRMSVGQGDDDTLILKGREYRRQAADLAGTVSRATLGLDEVGGTGGYGAIPLYRA